MEIQKKGKPTSKGRVNYEKLVKDIQKHLRTPDKDKV